MATNDNRRSPAFPELLSLSSLAAGFTSQALRTSPKPVLTGWDSLDQAIGGLFPGLYVLGAISGLGKSTFALQMAEQIAARGTAPVLYFSLEMDSRAIAAKSLARRLFLRQSGAGAVYPGKRGLLQSRDLLRHWDGPYAPPDALEAVRREMEEEAKGLYIITPQDMGPLTADKIVEITEGFFLQQAQAGAPSLPPVVIVDYLQIIPAPANDREARDARTAIDLNVQKLRSLYGLPILLISSLNRGSYLKPIELTSFKESGGIEYSADVLLGLQFTAVHKLERKNDGWLQEEKEKPVRSVEISILKQRYGPSGVSVPFRYYAAYDHFQEQFERLPQGKAVPEETPLLLAPKGQAPGPDEGGPVFKMNNTEIAKELRFYDPQHFEGGAIRLHPFANAKDAFKREVETTVSVSAPLAYWDMMVADAIFTLYQERSRENRLHERSFRAFDLLRLLSGDPKKPYKKLRTGPDGTPAKGVCWDIIRSIEHMRTVIVTIECQEELEIRARDEAHGKGETYVPDSYDYTGRFLLVDDKEHEGSPVREEGLYWFPPDDEGHAQLQMPLYQYAQKLKQVLSFPLSHMATPQGEGGKPAFSDTPETLAVKHYMARTMALAQGIRRRQFSYINFDTPQGLFASLGLRDSQLEEGPVLRRKRRKGLSYAVDMLRYYRDSLGLLAPKQELPKSYKKRVNLYTAPKKKEGKNETEFIDTYPEKYDFYQ